MPRVKRTLLYTTGILVLIVILIIVFLSPIVKYLVEKYDVQYTGREITMDFAVVNPLTGYIYFNDIRIHELKSDSVFFYSNGLGIDFALQKLFSKTYEITNLRLDGTKTIVVQSRDNYNFDDLVAKLNSAPKDTTLPPVHFNLLDIKIRDSEFHFRDSLIPVNYFVKNLDITSEGVRWDNDSINADFSFESGIGSGTMEGHLSANLATKKYMLALKVNKFDLNIINQYLKDLTNYGTFRAFLDADFTSTGSTENDEDFTLKGNFMLSDFHFGKTRTEDYASFKRLAVGITELSPSKYIFHGDSLILDRPFFRYEKYDSLDNLQTMFGEDGSNITAAQADSAQFNMIIEIADFVKDISRYFFDSHYKINRLAVNNANLEYNDYSLTEKFSMALDPFTIYADSIDKNHKIVQLTLKGDVKPYGEAAAYIDIHPRDSNTFDLNYIFDNMSLPMFNPYTIASTSFPFDRGRVKANGDWKVRQGNIDSYNHLVILDPRLTKKLRNKETPSIPMRLVLALTREQGNVIDYEIPIKGDLKDPKFKIGDVITDILENIFVKPVRTNYRVHVKHVESEIEKSLSLKWPMRKSTLLDSQEKFIEKMSEFLKENPEASIDIYPQQFEAKEKEYILLFEARKRYYIHEFNKTPQTFNEEDSAEVEKMSVKDKAFEYYIHANIKDSLKFTIQEKCAQLISKEEVNRKYAQLLQQRKIKFLNFFTGLDVNKQIHFHASKDVIPFNGFSFFKISYSGELPKSLEKAYNEIDDLNEKPPREKFRKDREKKVPAPDIDPNVKKESNSQLPQGKL